MGISPKQKEIVILPFPYSNQIGKKVRPAIVLSNNQYNADSQDIIVCAVTSTKGVNSIAIKEPEKRGLRKPSFARADTIIKIHKSSVEQVIGSIEYADHQLIVGKLTDLLS